MAQRVLITGGAGFIGSHLADRLLARGDEVWVIDDLSTGSIDNVRQFESNPRFHLSVDTVLDDKVVASLMAKVEVVYHLAAAVGVQYIIDNPLRSLQINLRGTENVLEVANRGKQPVLIASTSEIYGKNEKVPFRETDDRLLGPTTISRWSYSCSKAIDEFLALAYWREKKLPVVIVRFFNTCGPRQSDRYGMVIPRLVRQALKNEPLTVYGDGGQTRSFTYVSDVIDGITALMAEPRAIGEIYNIGNDRAISILELAEM
ncbi:MAG TPA: GDP-mannose 4,6-dehydratase, partial [bacterium]|nr:GDP-mannose 4,6-dehydratase [bacterium]